MKFMHQGCVAIIILVAGAMAVSSVHAGTVTAEVVVRGKIFNKPSRQHVQANFRGTGTHRPSGQTGTVNGGASSTPGMRSPQADVLGTYVVNVRALVLYGGGSTSRSIVTSVNVRRKKIIVGGLGRIKLSRPIKPNKSGSQRIRGRGNITIPTPD